MEDQSKIITLLERIAIALERIADSTHTNYSPKAEADTIEVETSLSSEPELENNAEFNDTSKLQHFLSSRGITIKSIPPKQEIDETLDKIAVFMGNKLDSIKGVLEHIKKTMSTGRSFTINFKNEPQQTIADTTNLCTNLYKIAFLTTYRYQKSPAYILFAVPSTMPRALNFYSGQWLERFVKTQVISLLQSRSIGFSYLCNPQIILPNGDDFEIDMLFEIDGEVFWLEAKTGDYQRHIEKYAKMSTMMGLDRSHTFMILADSAVTDDLARDLSNLFGMTVVRTERFSEQLAKLLPENHNGDGLPQE